MPGLILYALGLAAVGFAVPPSWWDGASPAFLFLIGFIGVWRYGWGAVHLARSLIYRHLVYPRLRRRVEGLGSAGLPGHVYLLVTSFRISETTTRRVYGAAIEEAVRCGLPCTVVASIVDAADERLIKRLFARVPGTDEIGLTIVRIPGTGKRDALAHGLRAIAADLPAADAAVCVIDGDSIVEPGMLRASLPFLKAGRKVGAFTTDEVCEVEGSRVFRDWYAMRFAQRQILMSSMGLSRRVLTLTGRMSAFRASIVCRPDFIAMIENDHVDHWCFGDLRFLTGDDKSSWFYLLRGGYEMLYLPDVRINTIETPPDPDFGAASTQLMVRWFGNMLRTNSRALRLGPGRIGLFTWWCIFDQRISMWTSLTGLTGALLMALSGHQDFLLAYIFWVALTRFAQTLVLLTARRRVSWTYPFLLYYNQVWGSAIKTYMLFHQDRQKWTRQKTVLADSGDRREARWQRLGSVAAHVACVFLLVATVGSLVGVFDVAAAATAIFP